MTNILSIPSHVVLPEDQIQMLHQYTAEEENKLDESILALKQQIESVGNNAR